MHPKLRVLPLGLIVALAAAPAFARERPPKSRVEASLSTLRERLSRFLRRTHKVHELVAVAAVRGANPLGPAADFGKKLGVKSGLLRKDLRAESPAEGAEASLRRIYRALATVHLVRSAEMGGAHETRGRAVSALKEMAADLRNDGMPESLLRELASATAVNFAIQSGVAKRWLSANGLKLAYAANAPAPAAPKHDGAQSKFEALAPGAAGAEAADALSAPSAARAGGGGALSGFGRAARSLADKGLSSPPMAQEVEESQSRRKERSRSESQPVQIGSRPYSIDALLAEKLRKKR